MLSSLLGLMFVFGLLGAALFLLRRWGRATTKGHHLEVVETVVLGPGKSLSVVAVGRRSFLLAATNDRISLVSELETSDLKVAVDPPENNRDIVAGFDGDARPPTGYLHSLNSVVSRRAQRDGTTRVASART